MINKIITSVSLSVIGWGVLSIYNLYKEHIKFIKSNHNNSNSNSNSNSNISLNTEGNGDIKNKLERIKEKEKELDEREKSLQREKESFRIREEVIINMEKAYATKNDQLTELINSMNNFSKASENIVKSYQDNFCVISN